MIHDYVQNSSNSPFQTPNLGPENIPVFRFGFSVWGDLRSVPSDSGRTVANSPPGMTTTCVSAGNHEGNLCHPHTPKTYTPGFFFSSKSP